MDFSIEMTYSYKPLLKTQYTKNTRAFPFQFYKVCHLYPLWEGGGTAYKSVVLRRGRQLSSAHVRGVGTGLIECEVSNSGGNPLDRK